MEGERLRRNASRDVRQAALLVLLLAAGCVGPSRTAADYRRKVANSAEKVVSTVESALLTTEVAADGRAPWPYVALQLSESAESAGSVETALAAVQPPEPQSDALRERALDAIGDSTGLLEELRIAAYREDRDRLVDVARELDDPLSRLRRLMEVAPT